MNSSVSAPFNVCVEKRNAFLGRGAEHFWNVGAATYGWLDEHAPFLPLAGVFDADLFDMAPYYALNRAAPI